MTANVTLGTLQTRILFLGDFQNSRLGQNTTTEGLARLTEVINANLRKVYDLFLQFRPDPFVTEQSGPPVTIANNPAVALVAGFYRLREVEILDSGNYYRLRPVSVGEAWRFNTPAAAPRGLRYRVQGTNLILVPTPTAVYTLRVYYFPAFTALAATNDTFDGINGFEDLVIARSIVDLKMREQMPAGEWQARADALTRELMDAAELDSGQPFFLSGTGPDGPDEDQWFVP